MKKRHTRIFPHSVGLINDITQYSNAAPALNFTFTVKTDNSGTSSSDQFTLPLKAGETYDYTVDWGDGSSDAFADATSRTHTYPAVGSYQVSISGTFPVVYFNDGGDKTKVTSVDSWGQYPTGADQIYAFYGLANCTSFAAAEEVDAWANCTRPAHAWRDCSSLTSFPLLDMSNGTNFSLTWYDCSSLTSFPLLDVSSGTNFFGAWYNCSSLTSFPLLDLSSGTNFNIAWRNCSSLTSFPANFFDTWVGVPVSGCFTNAWADCSSLTSQSVENILVSIDTSGKSAPATGRDIRIDYDGSGLTGATTTAITSLKAKNWTVTINGTLQ